jgi:hypothetical protein
MNKIEKKTEASKFSDYIKGIINMRYGDSSKCKESKYLGLKDNMIAIDIASRPLEDKPYPCIVLLTKNEDIFVLFATDLPVIDSDSLSELRLYLKEIINKMEK